METETRLTVKEAAAWWTVKELADHYKIGVRTVYDAIDRGELFEKFE